MSEMARLSSAPGALWLTLGAAILAPMGQAAAEGVSPLAVGFLGETAPRTPLTQRYAAADGASAFMLDRSGPAPLLRFEGRDEVLVLYAQPGPRGDEFLKTDTGRVLLRITVLGGVTVYPNAKSAGVPVAPDGISRAVEPPAPPPGGLRAGLNGLSRDAYRALGQPVAFEVTGLPPQASGLAYDAAARATEALIAVRARAVSKVVIIGGAGPQAQLRDDALRVVVAPRLGYAGRPSAAALEAALRR